MATLTAGEVYLDSLRPLVVGGALTDVIAVYQVRYVDENGATVTTIPSSLSSFGMMSAEQVAAVQEIYSGMLAALKAQYGVA